MKRATFRAAARLIIGVLVAGAGIAHFTNAEFFTKLVPDSLQAHAGRVNAVTGVIQTGMGLCFFVPALRFIARWSTIVLLVVTLPAAINQVLHPAAIEQVGLSPALAAVRVVTQIFMIGLIWWVTQADRNESRSEPTKK